MFSIDGTLELLAEDLENLEQNLESTTGLTVMQHLMLKSLTRAISRIVTVLDVMVEDLYGEEK